MAEHFHTQYAGWNIEIFCEPRISAAGDAPRLAKLTATAHASLIDQSESGDQWIDARTQIVGLGNRSYETYEECVRVLLADVRELIEVLRIH